MLRKSAAVAAVAIAVFVAAGCSEKYSAERDGKDLGQAVCDLRDADNAQEVQDAQKDIVEQLDDLGGKYAMYTGEDRADVQNNLSDLAKHATQGNDVLKQQDLRVLERSVKNIAEDSDEVSDAAWDGFFEGLSDCTS